MIDWNHGRRVAIVGLALGWLFAISAAPAGAQSCASWPDGTDCNAGTGNNTGKCWRGICVHLCDLSPCPQQTCRTATCDPATAACQYFSQPDGAVCSSPSGAGVCEGGACVEPSVLGVTNLFIKLDFAKPALHDTIVLKAALAVPDGFTAAGAHVLVDVGGVVKSFDLDTDGRAKADTAQVKLAVASKRGVVLAQDAKLRVKLANGSFASWLADEGLTDTTVTERPVSIPVRLVVNGQVYATTQPQTYTAKTGKAGKTK